MKKQNMEQETMVRILIIILICFVFILSISSASAIYPGESQLYLPSDFGLNNFVNVSIQNNVSFIGYEFNENWINITIPTDADAQTFTIIFGGYVNEAEKSVQVSGGSSEEGSSVACYRGYQISPWTSCVNNFQSRIVSNDLKTCYQTKQEKPSENQSCSNNPIIPENNTIVPQEPKKEFFLWTWWNNFWNWIKSIFGK